MRDCKTEETAVIGLLLAEPAECVPEAMRLGVKAEWFTDDTWRVFWIAIDRLWHRGAIGEADAMAIYTEARKVSEEPEITKRYSARVDVKKVESAITQTTAPNALPYHIDQLRQADIERRVRAAGLAASTAFAHRDAVETAIALRAEIDSILAGEVSSRKIDAAAIYREILEEYRTAYQKRIVEKDLRWSPGLKMPWPALTALMNGLEPGLGIIAARPSVGKTLFAVNLMRYWCDTGIHVVFNTLDMQSKALLRRFIAERARVSISKARFSPTKFDLSAMEKAATACAAYPLQAVAIKDVDEFRTFCMIERAAGRCQIAVVDYLGLLHSTKVDNGNEYARVSYVSGALKNLSNELGIPVIALCQLNRDVAKSDSNREPGLVDLRGSGSIEQDAFWVILLHRQDDVVNGTWRTSPPVQLTDGSNPASVLDLDSIFVILCKAQNGKLGKMPFVFRKNYLSCSLGDPSARPLVRHEGHGVTAREVCDYTPMFSKVTADWRHDPFEAVLRSNGALIESTDAIAADTPPPVQQELATAHDDEEEEEDYQ